VVLEVAPPAAPAPGLPARAALLPLSARSPEALRALAARHADLLAADGAPPLADLCGAAANRRTHLEHRAAFVAADAAGAIDLLRRFAAGEPATAEGRAGDAPARVAFVFPGQGAQWSGMARELLATEPAFQEALERCDRAARRFLDVSIVDVLRAGPGSPAARLDDIDVVQPVLVALSVAYAALWRSLGVEPHALVGHSMGEVAAACVAGALDVEQAMEVVCRRSALMRRVRGRGAMALVELSLDAARARIAGREARISVAASNGPRSTVLSGDPDAVQEVLAGLEREGVFCRLVKVDVASHGPQMEPLAAELAAQLRGLAPRAASVAIHSTALGRPVAGDALGADYWARNLRQPVLFDGAIRALLADGVRVFVELGPHPILLPSIEQTAQAAGVAIATAAAGRREEDDRATALAALGAAWAAGARLEWSAVQPRGRHVTLPTYPWQRERHWAEAAELRDDRGAGVAEARLDEEAAGWLHRLAWEPADPGARGAAAPATWLVVGAEEGAGPIAGALRAAGARAEVAPLAWLEEALAATDAEAVAVLAADDADAPFLPLRALQGLLAAPAAKAAKPPRLWILTRGGQRVADGDRGVAVDHGAAWGAARVVAEEHPDLWGGLVDLDPALDVAAGAPLLARHLLAADGEEQVALRGGRRHALRVVQGVERRGPAHAWRRDASYLVTGGLGDLGLHVARAMVAAGARRLVLLGRTPLPPRAEWAAVAPGTAAARRVAAVRALEASGAAVHVATLDVADEVALRAFLDRWTAEGRPPIRGVVHAAAALDNRLAATMDRRAFDAVLRPKLRGAQLLDRLLPDLELFVLFSSVVGFLAQPGEANYAAANAGLDALAQDRRARGLPALAVAWGVWSETGFASGEAGERVAAVLGRQGIRPFTPEAGTATFRWLCGRCDGAVAVLPIDWATFRKARTGRGRCLYGQLLAGGPDGAGTAPPGGPAARPEVERIVRESVSRVLRLPAARLDRTRTLGSLGLTSLLAMELRNRLEAGLGRSLPATLAWNYPTVAALVDHLAGGAPAQAAPGARTAGGTPAPAAADLGAVAELTDEEAALALRASPRGAR
jgi:acyl transferase domain-containing protein